MNYNNKTDKEKQSIFLDWFNNYLTYEKFSSDYGINIEQAEKLIEECRAIHERLVKEIITTKASKELRASKKFLDEKIIFIQG
jgi:hypothetical protein